MKTTCGNQKGTSLIEILVVLVVLMVGVLSAIRVFPIGFGVIQHSGDMTIASRFAQHELASWTADPACLPDGVFPNVSTGYPLPGRANGNDFLRVVGESTVVPSANLANSELPTYVVRLGPVDIRANMGDTHPFMARTDALEPAPFVQASNSYETLLLPAGNPQVRDLQRYQIDESSNPPRLFFRPTGYATRIYADYEYIDTNDNRVQYRTQTALALSGTANYPANPNQPMVERVDLPKNADFASLVPGSVKVYRALDFAASGAIAGSTNPFCFGPKAAPADTFGVLQFHPGLQGTRVYMDYRILDGSILHEDVRPLADLSGGPCRVRLSIPFLKDPQSGSSVQAGYTSLLDPAIVPDGTVAAVVTLGGAATGNPNSAISPGEVIPIASGGNWTTYKKDLRAGIIQIEPDAGAQAIDGALVRVYYRCDGDWAMHLSKAYSLYAPQTATGDVAPGFYRPAGFVQAADSPYQPPFPPEVTDPLTWWEVDAQFPLCDLGKSAVADVQMLDKDGRVLAIYPGTFFRISDMAGTGGNAGCAVGYALVKLIPDKDKTPPAKVLMSNVRGVSVKVRMSWKESDQVKTREVDSILNR